MLTSVCSSTRRSDVQFRADGQINLSAHVTQSLSLCPGDVIDIAVDENDGVEEYYLYAAHRRSDVRGRHIGACRSVNKGGTRYLRVNNVRLCRYVLDRCRATECVRVRAGEVMNHAVLGLCMVLVLRR